MNEYLKGNYKAKQPASLDKQRETKSTDPDALEQEFERRSLEKLGGSIAFIMKSKNLLWKGTDGRESDAPHRD